MVGVNKQGITISSQAMYSSYCWHQPTRTAFDVGEGFSRDMGARIFGVERVCLSHLHTDHVGGLINLIGLRATTKGDSRKPLDIYAPGDSVQYRLIKDYIAASWPRLPYKLTWYDVAPGFELTLSGGHTLKCFPMEHQRNVMTLGWKVVESRSRLKREHVGKDIRALIMGGMTKDQLNETYSATTFVYALDHFSLDPADIAGAQLAIMDCTFINAEDRTDPTHATLEESLALCKGVGVKHMIAAHLSVRYSDRQIDEAVQAAALRYDPSTFQVCHPSSVLEL